MKGYFVTAIGTDSGKTLVSAILCQALHADYWKPIQAGAPYDRDTVSALVSRQGFESHPEAYLLEHPMSPHAAAALQGISISLHAIHLPISTKPLIVEGAGGLMVPINDKDLMADLILKLGLEVILVSNNYLGSINHTLLTAKVLQQYGIKVKGIVFNGDENKATESIILSHTGYHYLFRIPKLGTVDKQTVATLAQSLNIDL